MSRLQTDRGIRTIVSERSRSPRQRVLDAGAMAFAASDIEQVTMSHLAELAGVRTHVIYSLFGSKAGLVAAIARDRRCAPCDLPVVTG